MFRDDLKQFHPEMKNYSSDVKFLLGMKKMCCIYVDFSYPEVKFVPPGFQVRKCLYG